MNEDILKDDPLKKPKKITVAAFVAILAVLAVGAFASFHWICADYFNFKANEDDARKRLDDIRARIAEEEAVAKRRIGEMEEKAKASEAEAIQRVKASTDEAQKRILDAEQSAKVRIDALEQEYLRKREAKTAEHQKLADELDGSIKSKKSDIAVLLRGYKERFDVKTNDYELAIARKNVELLEVERKMSTLPDIKGQLSSASNALLTARKQRDVAMREKESAQETCGKWSAKADTAKARLDEMEGRRAVVENELDVLSQETNAVCLAIVKLKGQVQALRTKIAAAQAELQSVQGDVENANTKLDGVNRQVADAEKKRKAAETARSEAETALNVALDKKREAESVRDKARSEAAQAEAHWAKRKPEIEGLVKDMERILEMRSKAVKSTDNKKEGGVQQ